MGAMYQLDQKAVWMSALGLSVAGGLIFLAGMVVGMSMGGAALLAQSSPGMQTQGLQSPALKAPPVKAPALKRPSITWCQRLLVSAGIRRHGVVLVPSLARSNCIWFLPGGVATTSGFSKAGVTHQGSPSRPRCQRWRHPERPRPA